MARLKSINSKNVSILLNTVVKAELKAHAEGIAARAEALSKPKTNAHKSDVAKGNVIAEYKVSEGDSKSHYFGTTPHYLIGTGNTRARVEEAAHHSLLKAL